MLFSVSVFATNGEFNQIMLKVRQWNVYSPPDSLVQSYMGEMQANGSWDDINYNDQTTTWLPQVHYYRLLPMAYAYISPENTFYNDTNLYNKIVLGINYWLSINPHSPNWYHNKINEPLMFGLILIAMRDGQQLLPAAMESQIIQRWRNNGSNPASYSGSNKSEMALHWIYFSCLTESSDTLNLALNYIFEPVVYTDGEGLQVDNSFLQHGKQLYIGGYGEVMLETVLQTAVCVAGTEYSLPDEKKTILRTFVLDSYANVIRGAVIHWNAIGRQLTRPDFLRYPERRIPIIEMMRAVDEDYSTTYTQILNRLKGVANPGEGVNPYHTHFYRGDYTIHVRPGYSFSTRMVSSRTCRQESINGENLLGYFLSDGATVITSSGNEYLDLMPLWDWNKIPGVTAPIVDTIPVIPNMSTYGSTNFAGGVNDSLYGCTAYKYFDEYNGINTGAAKGYFFFDDEVVCLGADISSNHNMVQTTINQCWGKEDVVVGTENGYNVLNGNVNQTIGNNYRWILHDGMGYYFPDTQQVVVENKEKAGNWRWISTMWVDTLLSGKVFTLGIQHPSSVQDGKYSYVIVPNSTTASLSSYATNNNIEILANTDSVQVVYHNQLKLYECVFYRACTFMGEEEIRSFQPCAMIIKEQNNDYCVHIADPAQSKARMIVGIKGRDKDEMYYFISDFTGIDEQYAGMTKVMDDSISIISVDGYNGTSGSGRWLFIASPVAEDIAPIKVENLIDTINAFDLYRFNQSSMAEWENYKAHTNDFVLENGKGYLYANSNNVELIFTGEMNADEIKIVNLDYDENAEFKGWNLVGNPFPVAATVDKSYYIMNENGTTIVPHPASGNGRIAACNGIMVQAEGPHESVTFSRALNQQNNMNNGTINISLAYTNQRNDSLSFVDQAVVSFSSGDRLGKYYFGDNKASVYIPQGNKEFAIACCEQQKMIPVNFKANETGYYTINVNPEGVKMTYLHLIDNLTGADVDLMVNPTYTFIASVADYPSRFKLLFNAESNVEDNETFAFINDGQIMILGSGMIQVIDMAGRVVYRGDNVHTIDTKGMASGVYVLRLIEGKKIKIQKIIVK